MEIIDSIKDKIRQLLIEKDGDVEAHDLKDIIDDAKKIGVEKNEVLKIAADIDASMNWEAIRAEKVKEIERIKKLKEEVKKQEDRLQSAPEFIDALVQYCFADGVVEKGELEIIFRKSDELKQDGNVLARKLKSILDKGNYKPLPNPNLEADTLRDTLLSTSWYNEDKYNEAIIALQPKPIVEPFPMKMALIGCALFFLVASSFVYFFYLKPKWRDDSAVAQNGYYYPIAEPFLMLNSTKVDKISENDIASLEYGTKMIVYDIESEWLTVKAKDKEGYVNPRYTLNRKDFTILNSIWGDGDAKASIESNKCRVAILNYFKQNNLIGKIDEDTQKDVFGVPQTSKDCWQVFAKGKDVKPNTVVFPHIVNPSSKFSDFGVIIKNTSTNKRKFLLFSFSDTEESTLVNEQDAPDSGYIKEVRKFFRNGNFVYDVIYSY